MFDLAVAAILVVAVTGILVNILWRRQLVPVQGKAILITGCDRGFGYLLAIHLATLGYRVFAGCLDVSGEGAVKLCKTSSNIVPLQLDVTDDEQVAAARTFLDNQLQDGRLWAVVNNAGIATFAEAEWCSLSQYQTMMNINWLGTVRVTKSVLPLVRAARGRVINVASLAGRIALPGYTSYSSSKFAVIGFSDSLRREMFKFGVKVITIEPSLYKTALLDCEVLTHQNLQMWTEAAQVVRHQYGEKYFAAFLSKLAKMLHFSSHKIHQVVDDITHAVTSRRPYTRYVPDLFISQLPSDGFSMLPNHFQDLVLSMLLKVPALPSSMALGDRNRS